MVNSTIQVSKKLKDTLQERKLVDAESYEEVIWDLLEDSMELNEETKREIEQARRDFKEGKYFSFEEVKKEAGF